MLPTPVACTCVSVNELLGRSVFHSYYRGMVFLLCEYAGAFSSSLSERTFFHTHHRGMVFLLCGCIGVFSKDFGE